MSLFFICIVGYSNLIFMSDIERKKQVKIALKGLTLKESFDLMFQVRRELESELTI